MLPSTWIFELDSTEAEDAMYLEIVRMNRIQGISVEEALFKCFGGNQGCNVQRNIFNASKELKKSTRTKQETDSS